MPSLNDDPFAQWMRRRGLALTRDNYIAMAWGNTPPEPWDAESEDQLPYELQDWGQFDGKEPLIDQDEIDFESPAEGPDNCSGCVNYGGSDDCEFVKPPIKPDDWCELFDSIDPAQDAVRHDPKTGQFLPLDGGGGTKAAETKDAPKDDKAEHLYHVTPTKNLANIRKQGLRRFRTSQWIQAGSGERYGGGEVYAFEHPEDALRWAAKMDWDNNQATGTGKISVVKFHPGDQRWDEDEGDPLSQLGRKGRWLKSEHPVKPEQIRDVTKVDREALAPLVYRG